ncbi:MAG: MarR family transcriptional regulator [Alphaproteobacteria bacterium]|nr:MarR family transcriptional regulator [Alphaproteobacteria bacterium]
MPPESLDRALGFVLHDVARLLRRRFDHKAKARKLGLTRAQFSVLAHMARHRDINQNALAEILEVKPITLARLLDKLERQGFIKRRAQPGDRRVRIPQLTAKALPYIEKMRALGLETRNEAMAGLTQQQRDTLIDTLLAVKANLSERSARNGLSADARNQEANADDTVADEPGAERAHG